MSKKDDNFFSKTTNKYTLLERNWNLDLTQSLIDTCVYNILYVHVRHTYIIRNMSICTRYNVISICSYLYLF